MNFLKSLFTPKETTESIGQERPTFEIATEDSLDGAQLLQHPISNSEEVIELPEIPEELFVEHSAPSISNQLKQRNHLNKIRMDSSEKQEIIFDLQYLYSFLEKDYQQEGYNDALSNPDMSNMEEKVNLLRRQLDITIAKVNTYYSGTLRSLNFHIDSRSRNGMVDIVDELISKKSTIEEEISKVAEIEAGSKSQSGLSETLIMSYKLGFKNGYAAISHSQLI